MDQPEKPRIRNSYPPEVSMAHSGENAIGEHRDDIFFAAIETTRMPMIVADARKSDLPIIFANRAFLSMSGYRQEEIIGHNCRFMQGPGTDPETVRAVREAIAEQREISVEVLNYRRDGSSFWNALYISPVFNQQRELVYFFGSQLDVSRRRDAEDALGQAQKMEALGQLTGGISHDFNNLLQVMSGHLDILSLKLRRGQVDEDSIQRGVENIRAAVGKASTLTQQLLAFSRKQRLEGRPLNLNSIAEGITGLAGRTLGDSVTVKLELAPDLANCRLDPTQLEVALLNVLVNARDALGDDGQIEVRTRNLVIEPDDPSAFAGLPPGRYVSISISDNGSGIPEAILSRVMDPFFTTKDEGQGTGLGLSMVYGFAKQSGGTVHIQSEVDRGTTVSLVFPVSTGPARSAQEITRRAGDRGGDETILVVDDRPEVAALSADMLESLGYQVHVAHTARDALALFDGMPDDARPDLLFSDLIMPGGMNGFGLARELRRRMPGIKVLLTTGFSSDAEDSGTEYEVLKKPYRLSDLARRVRGVLDGATGSRR